MDNWNVPVALAHCQSYANPALASAVGDVLDASDLRVSAGVRVLVKPNLVSSRPLSCTTPAVVAAVSAWLLDKGAQVTVADSPGIGNATTVARAIGLDLALRPLGLAVRNMDAPVQVRLPLADSVLQKAGKPVHVGISRHALECDLVVSVPRLKAHRHTLLTMAVKNCFGCVPGVRKALTHMFHGRETDFFADCLAAIWAVLPPVAAVLDAVEVMHVTGPIRGQRLALGMLGASASAVALDEAVARALGVAPERLPLAQALRRRAVVPPHEPQYPLCRPEDFDCAAFVVPEELDSAWFHPLRILKSARARLSSLFRK